MMFHVKHYLNRPNVSRSYSKNNTGTVYIYCLWRSEYWREKVWVNLQRVSTEEWAMTDLYGLLMICFRHSDKTKLTGHANGRLCCHGLLTAVRIGYCCVWRSSTQLHVVVSPQHFPHGDGVDRPTAKSLWGNARRCLILEYFCNRRMNQFLHFGVWLNFWCMLP